MPHMQPQPCENGCCDGKCEVPTVTCDLRSEGLYSPLVLFEYTVDDATSALLEVTCPGEDPVVTDITDLLVDGSYSGVINSADPECFYRVCATNLCGTECCFDTCPDINLVVDQWGLPVATIDCEVEGLEACFCYLTQIAWSFSIVPVLQDTLQFGYIRFYRDGQEVSTFYLEPGLYSDQGVIELECTSEYEVVEWYVRTTCGKFKRVWRWTQDCTWLADNAEVEISGVDDISASCSWSIDPATLGLNTTYLFNWTLETSGFSAVNGSYEMPGVRCGYLLPAEITLGEVTIEYNQTVENRFSFGGPPQFTRGTLESVFVGTAVLRSVECGSAGLNEKATPPTFAKGIHLELHGVRTNTSKLFNITSGTPIEISTTITTKECSGYGYWTPGLPLDACPTLLFDGGVDAPCSIALEQPNLPVLDYEIGNWSDTVPVQLFFRSGSSAPTNSTCFPLQSLFDFPGSSARIRYIRN